MTLSRAEAVLVLVTMIAAGGWLFSKNALQDMNPNTFLAFRFLLGAVVLSGFCWPALRSLHWPQIWRSAATGAVLGVTLLFWIQGLYATSSIGESAFIVSLTVIVVPLIGRLLFAERIPRILPFALVPAVAGLALLTLESGFTVEPGQGFFLGATLGFALHLNLSSHYVKHIPSLANTSIQLLVVGLIALTAAVIGGDLSFEYRAEAWGWLLASAVLATSFRFALQNHSLKSVSPSHASMILLLEPLWTAILGAFMLGEAMSIYKLIGCGLIFGALVFFRSKVILDWLRQRFFTLS